jgi:hypothetical protein
MMIDELQQCKTFGIRFHQYRLDWDGWSLRQPYF